MYVKLAILSYILVGSAFADSHVGETQDDVQVEDMDGLIAQIKQAINQRDQIGFDSEDDLSDEVRRVVEEQGYDSNVLLADNDFVRGLTSLFSKGDGTRWTTLNFVYQLACYQGKKGRLFWKALWVWNTYNRYGCYCGSGYYRGNYLDATDHCCRIHDLCYTRVQKKYHLKDGCHTYTTPYHVTCCEDQRTTRCTDRGPSAGRELCECDQQMSRCVAARNATSTYSKSRYNNRSECKGDKAVGKKKTTNVVQIIKSCKHMGAPVKTFHLTKGSQGTCPEGKVSRRSGWLWGRK